MVLFFETYSIIQTLLLFRYIRKAEVIYFHGRSFPPLPYNPRVKKIVERLIRFFSRKVMIKTIPAERINEHNWVMNRRAVDVVEEMTADIKSSAVYKIILKIVRDENMIKAYQAQMVDRVAARLLFFRVAKDLITDNSGSCYLIPAANDNEKMEKESLGEEMLRPWLLSAGYAANRIRGFFHKVYASVIFLLLPTAYTLWQFRSLTLKKIRLNSYDIAMPVIFGFHDGEVIIDGVKRRQDDGYLYNNEIKRGQIVHIFNYWRFSPEVAARHKWAMKQRGIPYVDKKDYRMPVKLVLKYAIIQLKIVRHLLTSRFYCQDKREYIQCSNATLFVVLSKYLEFENVRYRVELVRNDYSWGHIVGTILGNQQGRKTVGLQHVASPYDLPRLCYVHMDRYIVYGDRLVKNFSPYWQGLALEKTGRENIDWVVKTKEDGNLLRELTAKLREKYAARRYLCVVLLPTGAEYNLRRQWDEMYAALSELKNLDIDVNVFLRFRAKDDLRHAEYIRRFEELPLRDERIIIDHTNFATYELISLCHLCIADCASFAVYEAAAAGTKMFAFDFMGTAKYFFSNYGKDFILYTRDDLLRVFRGLRTDFAGFDCDWDLVRKEGSYHYDGLNLKRIQNVVLETVGEVKAQDLTIGRGNS